MNEKFEDIDQKGNEKSKKDRQYKEVLVASGCM